MLGPRAPRSPTESLTHGLRAYPDSESKRAERHARHPQDMQKQHAPRAAVKAHRAVAQRDGTVKPTRTLRGHPQDDMQKQHAPRAAVKARRAVSIQKIVQSPRARWCGRSRNAVESRGPRCGRSTPRGRIQTLLVTPARTLCGRKTKRNRNKHTDRAAGQSTPRGLNPGRTGAAQRARCVDAKQKNT